ncbi:uncharacterized protein EV154DRAFT_476639 [Mucor mucedo]|uniref:uncharacterized protein n=1 Tax=Mucor mucedo TaxID=29922 RepID=UPI00221F4D41|nr:uncharacterized protein EV154DRAFT_558605 [Mucor mucedo]XP_051462686.1 uncharacterized protein EV154DRAFT_476639 [Mucor mucedo]KAI7896268.1 hypothetical protein EV154DRAFT_558605 [Mucor mucedo]KAI7896272.1 hypothetical protein EV154DRAFT_476639 [Mucor mucedo]
MAVTTRSTSKQTRGNRKAATPKPTPVPKAKSVTKPKPATKAKPTPKAKPATKPKPTTKAKPAANVKPASSSKSTITRPAPAARSLPESSSATRTSLRLASKRKQTDEETTQKPTQPKKAKPTRPTQTKNHPTAAPVSSSRAERSGTNTATQTSPPVATVVTVAQAATQDRPFPRALAPATPFNPIVMPQEPVEARLPDVREGDVFDHVTMSITDSLTAHESDLIRLKEELHLSIRQLVGRVSPQSTDVMKRNLAAYCQELRESYDYLRNREKVLFNTLKIGLATYTRPQAAGQSTQAPVQAPIAESAQVPAQAPVQAPIEVPTQTPTEEPAKSPIGENDQAPI